MARKYTAQDMRELADRMFDYRNDAFGLEIYDCRSNSVDCDATHDVICMLRQAADEMERERKYEYSQRRHDEKLGIDIVDMLHCSSLEGALDLHGRWNKNMPIVRREVGEWEEVEE